MTDDQVDSLIMLATNSTEAATAGDELQMPTFLYAMELVAEGVPEYKFKEQQGYASGGKMRGRR